MTEYPSRCPPFSRALIAAAALVAVAACTDDPRHPEIASAVTGPRRAANVGAIWNSPDNCSDAVQNVNHYSAGQVVSVNGNGFDPGTYAWHITGNPGGASADPGINVAEGTLEILANGSPANLTGGIQLVSVTGHQFCFKAYRVRADDNGEYSLDFGASKNDNYRVHGIIDLAKTANVAWTRNYTWTIDKQVSPTSANLFVGEGLTLSYTVALVRTADPTQDVYAVSGTITVNNTSDHTATVPMSDCLQVQNGTWANVGSCQVIATSLAPGITTYSYNFPGLTLDQTKTYRNLVAVDTTLTATAAVVFPAAPTATVNGTVNVTDTNGQSWQASGSTTFNYSKSVSCTTANGRNDVNNTATITETAQTASASASYYCYQISVAKTAATAYTKTWDWTVLKSASPLTGTIAAGEPIDVNYSIAYSATSSNSDFAAAGTITVTNPNPTRAAALASVTDLVSPDVAGSVTCPALSVPAGGGTLTCTYTATLPNADTRTNTATVVQNLSPTGTATVSGTASVNFATATVTEVDECIVPADTYAGAGLPATVCANQLPYTRNYTRTFNFTGGECGPQTIDNTASFVTNDRARSDSSAAQVVLTIDCVNGCTLTQGYWKTHSLMGPAPYDDNWASVGGASAAFFHGLTFYQAIKTPPSGGNAYYQLAKQYIAAVLNLNNGAATPPEVAVAMTTAGSLFGNPTYTPAYIGALKGTNALRAQYISLAGLLGSFNEGTIGPGHCTENPVSPP